MLTRFEGKDPSNNAQHTYIKQSQKPFSGSQISNSGP